VTELNAISHTPDALRESGITATVKDTYLHNAKAREILAGGHREDTKKVLLYSSVHTHTHTHKHTQAQAQHTHTHTHTHRHTHTHTRTHTHTHIHTHTHTHAHAGAVNRYAGLRTGYV
jgi:hypothetical protein